MSDSLSLVTYPTIKQLLWQRLELALDLYLQENWQCELPKIAISWRQTKDYDRIAYVCAIALGLSAVQNFPAMQIATRIANGLNCATFTINDFTVQVIPPGLIVVELTDRAIAARLKHLTKYPPNRINCAIANRDAQDLFNVQYTHARCCSLLHQAIRENLIVLEKPVNGEQSAAIFCVTDFDAIAFLDAQEQLLCCHAAEQALVVQLLSVFEHLNDTTAFPNWHKIAIHLSQAWQKFYADCRIWGETKHNLHLRHARLGLTVITQSCLRLLLNDKLGIFAPQEL